MAKPIEPTPVLTVEDSEALLTEVRGGVSSEEMDRRREAGRAWAARVAAPKYGKKVFRQVLGADERLKKNAKQLVEHAKLGFWESMREAAMPTCSSPTWAKAGIVLNEHNFDYTRGEKGLRHDSSMLFSEEEAKMKLKEKKNAGSDANVTAMEVLSKLLEAIHVEWSADETRPGVTLSYLGRNGEFYASVVRYVQILDDKKKCVVHSRRAKSLVEAVHLVTADFLSGATAKEKLRGAIKHGGEE